MDAMNVIPQASPAALFAFAAPVAMGKTGAATGASPAADSIFAELFAKVAVPETAIVKVTTDSEPEALAGAKTEKEGTETEVSSPVPDLAQVALAVPVMAGAVPVTPTTPGPITQVEAPAVQVQQAGTLAESAMQLPVQQTPSQAGPLVGLAVEAQAAGQTVDTRKASDSPQQKAGGQEVTLAAPQKAGVAEMVKDGVTAAQVADARMTVAANNPLARPVETAIPEQGVPLQVAVEGPAVPLSTVTVTPAAVPEPLQMAVSETVAVAVPVAQRPEDATQKTKVAAVDNVKALAAEAAEPVDTVTAEATPVIGTETVAAKDAPVQGRLTSQHSKREHAIPEVAADKPAVAGKEVGTVSEKDLPVMKAVSEKAAFSGESSDKEAKFGGEGKSGTGVSHNPLMGEAVKAAAVESEHKADGGRSATAENVLVQVKDTLALHNPKDAKQITMTLNPAELGELKINISMDGQQLKVHVVAENAMVRDVLLANIDTLKESLAKQNVTVERFNVSTGGSHTFNQPSGDQKWQPQRSSHHSYAAMGGMVADGEEQKIGYLNGTGTSLVDVRF